MQAAEVQTVESNCFTVERRRTTSFKAPGQPLRINEVPCGIVLQKTDGDG